VDSIIAAHPDRTVRAAFLFDETMKAFQAVAGERRRLSESDARTSGPGAPAASPDTTRFALLYDRLVTEYGDTWWGETARKIFPRERNIRPGREVPDFAVVSLDDSAVTFTPQSLRGRVYLIDLWAIWCKPCVAELPYLHAAHERFKDRGFTILSLSFDEHPLDVSDYRRSTWPMPWLHGFVQDGFDSELAQRFEVMGIPHSVLVDRSGTIRAVDLRGKALEEALAGMFADERVSKPD